MRFAAGWNGAKNRAAAARAQSRRRGPAGCPLFALRKRNQGFEIRPRKSIVKPMQVAPKQPELHDSGEFGQVLQFPQRRAAPLPAATPHPDDAEPLDDLARYEEDAPINYRQRTLMNVIAVIIVTLLIAAGVWIADTITGLEKDQDCVMQGRVNCAPIEVPDAK